jgi:pSer/pThr/pTyr-binding forkhead associated (FHA) protein
VHRFGYAFSGTAEEESARPAFPGSSDRLRAIEDLGSKNGTFVRGERATAPSHLGDGDEVRVGSIDLFRLFTLSGSTETAGRK